MDKGPLIFFADVNKNHTHLPAPSSSGFECNVVVTPKVFQWFSDGSDQPIDLTREVRQQRSHGPDANTLRSRPLNWILLWRFWKMCSPSQGRFHPLVRCGGLKPSPRASRKNIKFYRHRPQIALQEKLDTMARAGDKLGRHPTQSREKDGKGKQDLNHLITASASKAGKKMTRRQPRAKSGTETSLGNTAAAAAKSEIMKGD